MEMVEVLGMGVGNADLPPLYRKLMEKADVLVGGRRLLDQAASGAEQMVITSPLGPVLKRIFDAAASGKKVVVLADGDPLFFGIGRPLLNVFDSGQVRFHPNITVLQAAAARLGWPWEGIEMVSLHGRKDPAPLLCALSFSDYVGVYTDTEYTPQRIAREMIKRRVDTFVMHVFEDLGLEGEHAGTYRPEEATERKFSPLNFIVLERTKPSELRVHLGMDDGCYIHEHGQITKKEIRAAGLAALNIRHEHILWDLGAGSGSVAIEASLFARTGRVFAVEKRQRRVEMIRENIRRAGTWQVEAVPGEMPDCLFRLPAPDRIFVGGGLRKDNAVLGEACRRLRPGGRMVLHLVLLGSLHRAVDFFSGVGWPHGVSMVSVSRGEKLGQDLRMEALNPIFIVWAEKPGEK